MILLFQLYSTMVETGDYEAMFQIFYKEKEKALNHFKTFFEANEKAGGNNKHPTVSDLKTAIDML